MLLMNTTDNQTELVKSLLKAFQTCPKWAKIVISVAIATIVSTILLVSAGCASYAKVLVNSETPGELNISVSQPKHDSTGINVQVNPTITFPYLSKYGTQNETTERKQEGAPE